MNMSAFYVFGFFVAIIVVGWGLSYLVKRRGAKAPIVARESEPANRNDTKPGPAADSKKTP